MVGNGFWKLIDQLLKVPVAPLPFAEFCTTRVHVPGRIQARELRQRHLGVERREEGRGPVLNRSARIVVQDRVREIGSCSCRFRCR